MNNNKARKTALYGIIATLIFIGASIGLYFYGEGLFEKFRQSESASEGLGALIAIGIGLGMVALTGLILFITRLIFLIKSIRNAGRIGQRTSSTLILLGIFIPLVDVVGLCMLRRALK